MKQNRENLSSIQTDCNLDESLWSAFQMLTEFYQECVILPTAKQNRTLTKKHLSGEPIDGWQLHHIIWTS